MESYLMAYGYASLMGKCGDTAHLFARHYLPWPYPTVTVEQLDVAWGRPTPSGEKWSELA